MLQKFGIEIRRVGDTKSVFQDVDLILKNFGIPKKGVNFDVQRHTVAHALQNMIKSDRWFDVCTIKHCMSVCQICISDDRMDIYQAIHCIHWSSMTPEYRQTIIAMVLDDFREVLSPTE